MSRGISRRYHFAEILTLMVIEAAYIASAIVIVIVCALL